MLIRAIATLACTAVLAAAGFAQVESPASRPMPEGNMKNMPAKDSTKPLPSPAAEAHVSLNGKSVTVHYNAPSLRGRKMIGGQDPYGKVWRTGANEATTLVTATNLKIGNLSVPAGTYTLFTLPSADTWLLIVSKDTGEWGLAYKESMDLGRTPMKGSTLSAPQEKMSISFENTKGDSTELHVKWDTIDRYVDVTAE